MIVASSSIRVLATRLQLLPHQSSSSGASLLRHQYQGRMLKSRRCSRYTHTTTTPPPSPSATACSTAASPTADASSGSSSSESSKHHPPAPPAVPLSLGYVAGLQAIAPDSPWCGDYDEAYAVLLQVDPGVLREFERDMREDDGLVFRHSTRRVSVFDQRDPTAGGIGDDDRHDSEHDGQIDNNRGSERGGGVRFLVLNDRPNLIQSAIKLEYAADVNSNIAVGRPTQIGAPPPLVGPFATHLGGLALAAPLWHAADRRQRQRQRSGGMTADEEEEGGPSRQAQAPHRRRRPRAVVLGAGGCTVPAVLARAGWDVDAVEPCPDVREAAQEWFGVDNEAGITLVGGYGEDYLLRGKKSRQDDDEGGGGAGAIADIDVLIVDAEDGSGSAPPHAMRGIEFWRDAVVPRLAPGAVVAVNVIGTEAERAEIRKTVEGALDCDGGDAGGEGEGEVVPRNEKVVWPCRAPRVADVSDRHSILFATPAVTGLDAWSVREAMTTDGFSYVDREQEWIGEIERAMRLLSN